jgi:hypothetical protein
VSKRYQKARKKDKTSILDELVKTTGYNRKYVLYVLANWGKRLRHIWRGKPSGLRLRPTNGGKEAAGSQHTQAVLSSPAEDMGVFLIPVREDTIVNNLRLSQPPLVFSTV